MINPAAAPVGYAFQLAVRVAGTCVPATTCCGRRAPRGRHCHAGVALPESGAGVRAMTAGAAAGPRSRREPPVPPVPGQKAPPVGAGLGHDARRENEAERLVAPPRRLRRRRYRKGALLAPHHGESGCGVSVPPRGRRRHPSAQSFFSDTGAHGFRQNPVKPCHKHGYIRPHMYPCL